MNQKQTQLPLGLLLLSQLHARNGNTVLWISGSKPVDNYGSIPNLPTAPRSLARYP